MLTQFLRSVTYAVTQSIMYGFVNEPLKNRRYEKRKAKSYSNHNTRNQRKRTPHQYDWTPISSSSHSLYDLQKQQKDEKNTFPMLRAVKKTKAMLTLYQIEKGRFEE